MASINTHTQNVFGNNSVQEFYNLDNSNYSIDSE